MLRRWCVLGLLIVVAHNPVFATEVTDAKIQQIKQMPQFVAHIEALKPYYTHSDFQSLEILLAKLPPLTQEVARDQLIQYASEIKKFNSERIAWLKLQAKRQSPFTITEQGDGYTVTRLAFFYSNQANGLLHEWEEELESQRAMVKLELGKLTLSDWLTGNDAQQQQQQRSQVIVRAIPQLSEATIKRLVAQFHSDPQLIWLPDNSVLAALANHCHDEALYALLWRRRVDQFSLTAIKELAAKPMSDFVVKQLIAATANPSLKAPVYRSLTAFDPIPLKIKAFLTTQLSNEEDRAMITAYLLKQGHKKWIRQLLATSRDPALITHLKHVLSAGGEIVQ